jgi:predicted phage-related endonuclease
MSHFTLWHVKAGLVPPPQIDTPRTRAGIMLEDAIAHLVAHENGWTIERGSFAIDPTTPGMSCTTDWEITGGELPEGASGPGILECKNIDYAEWKRTWTNGEPPLHTLLQLQHQLACKGYTWGAIGGFIGGNTARAYPYLARPKLIQDIRRRVTAFWQSIKADTPPPVDGSGGAADVLRAMYPEVRDDAADMTASNEWPEACADFLAASAAKKEAGEAYDLARNRLAALLGDHKRGWGGGYSVSVSVTPEKADRPARVGEIIKGRAESRRIIVKEKTE